MSKNANKVQTFFLKDVLLKLDVSQRKLAKLMSTTQDWIGKIANGHITPTWQTVLRISRALDVSAGVFADNDPERLRFFQGGQRQVIDPMAASRAPGPKPKGAPDSNGRRRRTSKAS